MRSIAITTSSLCNNSLGISKHYLHRRLFVVRSDGSGSELLRLKDVQEYIGDAHLDPTSAVIKEILPDDNNAVGTQIHCSISIRYCNVLLLCNVLCRIGRNLQL